MPEYKDIKVEIRSRLAIITLNRPQKKNAITEQMYTELAEALDNLSNDKNTSITAITGAGDYYCSGTDLSPTVFGAMDEFIAKASERLRKLISAFINHKKILVAIVNGPAIGIAVTTLALCDVVYCSTTATFSTPFTKLGLSVEGCSSYLLPRIMGIAKANEMLLFNYKMSAEEALQVGIVAKVFPKAHIESKIWDELEKLSEELPVMSLLHSKSIIRHFYTGKLNEASYIECNRLEERWTSEEFMNAIMQFAQRSKMFFQNGIVSTGRLFDK